MKILLDNCVPLKFARLLVGHEVIHCSRIGWERLVNGRLLAAAEAEGFPVLVTVDRSMQFQQNMAGRTIAIIYLRAPKNSMPKLGPLAGEVLSQLENLAPGKIITISHPEMR